MDFQKYRSDQLRKLTNNIGVYALCDLDEAPIYVGQSVDGIRTRVRRHLTSARSDPIANRQLDVWEVAYVWAWPMPEASKEEITAIEHYLASKFNEESPLINGKIQTPANIAPNIPEMESLIVLPIEEIELRRDPVRRLPRQISHFYALFSYILEVKNNPELRRTLQSHFSRLQAHYNRFLEDSDES